LCSDMMGVPARAIVLRDRELVGVLTRNPLSW